MKTKLQILQYAFMGVIGILLISWTIGSVLLAPEAEACTINPNCTNWTVDSSGCDSAHCSCSNNPIPYTCYFESGTCNGDPNTNFILFRKCYVGGCCCPSGSCGGGGGIDGCEMGCPPEYVCVEGLCSSASPILIDVDGNGFKLTNRAGGVKFDLNADGTADLLSWTVPNSDDAWLVLDRDANGTIDTGRELFGNATLQSPPPAGYVNNGFNALLEFDKPENGGNQDGKITESDTIFSSLLAWQDTNHNGISESSELHSLTSLGITSLDCDYKESRRRDEHGNWFRYRAKVGDTRDAHLGKWAWDVFLVSKP